MKNLLNFRFGKLLVIKDSGFRRNNSVIWHCLCDCGNYKDIERRNLINGNTKSCGCSRWKDLKNKRFGRLLVLMDSGKRYRGNILWSCLCDCGNYCDVSGTNLTRGLTESCGCLQKERTKLASLGVKNFNWKNGSSKKPYPSEWTKELKEQIRNRDNRKCQFPECNYDDTKEKCKLDVHHIDGNKKNCKPENLISLCRKHHMIIEIDPQSWEYYFYQIIRDYI